MHLAGGCCRRNLWLAVDWSLPGVLEVYREKPLIFIIILARLIEPE
jgi:hypothetical protein